MRKGKGTVICYLLPLPVLLEASSAMQEVFNGTGLQLKALIWKIKEAFILGLVWHLPHHGLLTPNSKPQINKSWH